MDKLLVPKQGRVLVLCPDHIGDLLVEDLSFKQRYHDANGGKIASSYYGFEIYESTYAPKYDKTTLNKLPFGSATAGVEASVAFYKKNVIKATGTAKRYTQTAADNPTMRENTIGFRVYFVAVAIKDEGMAAIISG